VEVVAKVAEERLKFVFNGDKGMRMTLMVERW